MMSASLQGALAFQKGLGCVHSLSHSLGGIDPRLHHGTLNAIFLPAVIEFNRAAASVQRENCLARMAEAMRIGDPTKVPDAIHEMNIKLGLPKGLAEVGVARASFPQVIDRALADHCHKTNPRIATNDDYREILEASM
jgi:alcohol dehydrogenase class IV